jgi:hypothetical protein
MRYQKPKVIDLGDQARYAAGAKPLLCFPGNAADDPGEACVGGTVANYTVCRAGAVADNTIDCAAGTGDTGNCLAGVNPGAGGCSSGAVGFGTDDCTSGPNPS